MLNSQKNAVKEASIKITRRRWSMAFTKAIEAVKNMNNPTVEEPLAGRDPSESFKSALCAVCNMNKRTLRAVRNMKMIMVVGVTIH